MTPSRHIHTTVNSLPSNRAVDFHLSSSFRLEGWCRTWGAELSPGPILNPQPGHTLEFTQIVADQDQVARFSLPGDEHVEGSDRRSLRRQFATKLSGGLGVGAGEIEDGEISQEKAQGFEIVRDSLAPIGAEKQFVHND